MPDSPSRHPSSKWLWIVAAVVVVGLVGTLAVYHVTLKASEHRDVVAGALSPDGTRVATAHGMGLGTTGSVHIWNVSTGREERSIDDMPTTWVMGWSPDGKMLAAGFHDGSIRVWDASDWRLLATLEGISGYVDHLAWSPDSKRIAAGGDSGVVRIWEAASGAILGTHAVHSNNVACVVWSPDGALLASGGWDNTARVIEAATGRQLLAAPDTSYVEAIAWSPDGRSLAFGGFANVIHVYDVAQARETLAISGHKNSINDLAWSPDQTTMVSSGNDHAMRIWNAATGEQREAYDIGSVLDGNLEWSPDGTKLAVAGDGFVSIWRAGGGFPHRIGPGEGVWGTKVSGWSPDSRNVLTVDRSNDVAELWDVESETKVREFRMPLLEGVRRYLF